MDDFFQKIIGRQFVVSDNCVCVVVWGVDGGWVVGVVVVGCVGVGGWICGERCGVMGEE